MRGEHLNPFRFRRRSLQRRIVLLVGLGMSALAAILGTSILDAGRELSRQALDDRLHLAQALADHFDDIVKSSLVVLQDVALGARANLGTADLKPLKAALREAYLHSIFTDGVFLLDRAGQLVWIEPQPASSATIDFATLPPVRRALETGRPEVSGLVGRGRKRIYAAVPIRNWSGNLMGVAGGALDPESPRFRGLLHVAGMGATTSIDLVDDRGVVLVSTKAHRAFTQSDHRRVLGNAIRSKQPVVGSCHDCHEEHGLSRREPEIIAFAPLTFAPWGVSIRESEAEAFAPALTLRRRLVAVGSLTILVALLFAWGTARSVTKPLAVLSEAVQRVAAGNLDQPTPPLGEDEIGALARSFDQMRAALRTSLETIARWNRDLEERVQNRTREIEALYRELRRKEEMRGELLKKVIAAQEEERRRIARELHDETSQASAALLLAIEASSKSAPRDTGAWLGKMKVLAGRILDSIHRLIFDLRPSMLDDLGLPSALRSSAESRLEPLGLDLSFEVLGSERRLKPEIETALFRIGQEAIANIRRHAEAESVKIEIEFADRFVHLRVADDGKGFNPEEIDRSAEAARGLGLLGMKERAALLDGTLTIHSEPGKGTQVAATIPTADNPASHGAR